LGHISVALLGNSADQGSEVAGSMVKYRTIFLSDLHLGTRGCQADMLLDFLDCHSADTYYLVGDIFDGWRLKRGWHWPQNHSDVIQHFLSCAHDGAKVYYIPGNHDEVMRKYLGTHFGGIEVMQKAEFITADERRFLVTHGDQFDTVVVNAKWLAHVGDRAYNFALWLNTWANRIKRLWGGQYWSLSNWAKQQVKRAVNFIGEYEAVLTEEARREGYDGIICGHIHRANMADMNGIEYINTGDWVESCTAVVERGDGTLQLIDWAATIRRRQIVPAVREAPPAKRRHRARRLNQAA
jgi:UDP-2,3-diacylglucosamine pyrophosphatase LpxH